MMTDSVVIWKIVNSCETCPCGHKEQYGKYRCGEDTSIEFQQNRDMGVPAACPYKKRKVPCS